MKRSMKSRLELYADIRFQTMVASIIFALLAVVGLLATAVMFRGYLEAANESEMSLWLKQHTTLLFLLGIVATVGSIIGCVVGIVSAVNTNHILSEEKDTIIKNLSRNNERKQIEKPEYSEEIWEMWGELSSQVFRQPGTIDHI